MIYLTNEIEMAHLRMNGRAGTALPSKWSLQSSQRIKIDHSSPLKAAGDVVGRVVGFLDDGWRVADKLRANRCEGAAFCKIEKVTKLKTERGTSRWLQTSNLTPARQLLLEWGMGVGGVKGDHRIKVREALDLVTFLTGLLNSHLRVITMENPKDTINLYV
jgi:hypothetical protein